ncbi:MAG: PaaI family thioesterase [Clostridium perfringens]|nr:PaaI family thioesterase [Clostridium perfringens]
MKIKVVQKQYNGKKCIVCGLKNDFGLKSEFYELENGELLSVCKTKELHQSYPGRVHGGISSAILDEVIARAIAVKEPGIWGVTVELNIKYKKPVPLEQEIKAIGRITRNTRKIFEGEGEIILENGDIAVTAAGKYIKMPIEKISGEDLEDDEWTLNITENDLKEVDLP